MDVVIRERATGAEVERIPVHGEREANRVLSGVRINLGPDYRAAVEPSRAEVVTLAYAAARRLVPAEEGEEEREGVPPRET